MKVKKKQKKEETDCKFNKNFIKRIFSTYGLFFLGLIFVIGGLIWQNGVKPDINNVQNSLCNMLITIGGIISASGILAGLSSIDTVVSGIRNILIDLLHERKYIDSIKDKRGLWEKVTKSLVEERFIQIHDELFEIIVNRYLPTNGNNIKYYENHITTHNISWQDKENWILKVKEEIEFTLHAEEDCGSSIYEQKHWSDTCDYGYNTNNFSIIKTELLGGEGVIKSDIKEEKDGIIYHKLELEGSKKYRIKKTIERLADLKVDNGYMFVARYLTQGAKLNIVCPSDLVVELKSCGTLNTFEKKYLGNATIFENNSLILPNQGFLYFFQIDFKKHDFNELKLKLKQRTRNKR